MCRSVFKLAFCASLLLQAISAQAATVSGEVDVVDIMLKPFDYNNMSTTVNVAADGKTFTMMGSDMGSMNGGMVPVWDYDWMLTANADPFIESTFTITNLTSSTQTFNVNFNLPVTPPFSPGFKSGSLGINFIDTNNDGSASATLNYWNGLIDGANALQLFTFSIPCSGVGCSGNIAPVSTGPVLHAAGVNSTLDLNMSFDLTAGDTMTVSTRFEVSPVPVPAAAWLFGSGLLGLFGFSKRKLFALARS